MSGIPGIEVSQKWWAVAQVAKALNVSGRTVRNWCAAGLIGHLRIGGTTRISDTDLREFMARVHREAQSVRAGREPGAFAQQAAALSRTENEEAWHEA